MRCKGKNVGGIRKLKKKEEWCKKGLLILGDRGVDKWKDVFIGALLAAVTEKHPEPRGLK